MTANTLSNVITPAMVNAVFTEFMALVATVLPTVFLFMAFRKGWGWVMKAVRKS